MIPFLEQVARRYYTEGIEGRCFIFPNRRSMVFFRKYLSETLARAYREAGHGMDVKPVIAPEMYTINDFFCRSYGVPASDRVTLLVELYGCYRQLNPKAEALDEFIFWGDVILGDFNDVDKYLADPRQLYTNISDFKDIQDTYSYLSDRQRKAIENFVSHFNDRSGRLTVDLGSDNPNVKERFLRIWNILYLLYDLYNNTLRAKNLAYEGMIYRDLAESAENITGLLEERFPHSDRYVFVGLNALNECEKTLMRRLRDAGTADFCWDYSGDMIKDRRNRSSFFMSENVKEFPQKFQPDPDGVKVPVINVISVPSSVGQVKQIPKILGMTDTGRPDYSDCAIVLPDENLLMPLLNTIPPEIKDINVTMGYPMSGSEFYDMMSLISAIQLHTSIKGDRCRFYYKQVWALFSNSIFKKAAGDRGMELVASVKEKARLYIPREDLSVGGIASVIFTPVVTDAGLADKSAIDRLADYQLRVISAVAPALKDDPDMAIELEFAKEYYGCINRIKSIGLAVRPLTYIRLLDRLLGGISVPFKGEPLKGLQIMGPLETRALDFANMIILSCNEGTFPRRSVSSSFIPPELRKGFGLPTYEFQEAVWAYYFYRMITRADNVWMLYDSRTEGLKSGEESRYIKQLRYHFGVELRMFVAKADLHGGFNVEDIEKTREDIDIIRKSWLSASSVQNYLACPAKFYYHTVRKLGTEKEVSEAMDAGMIGNVYHNTMQALYIGDAEMASREKKDKTEDWEEKITPLKVRKDYLSGWLKRKREIKDKIKSLIEAELNSSEVTGRDLVVADVILRYVLKTIERDIEQLDAKGLDSFTIYGLELKASASFGGLTFFGYIDRLDGFSDGEIRIVDYKTGKVEKNDKDVNEDNAEAVADAIFGDKNTGRPKIAFQFFIYDMLLRNDGRLSDRGLDITGKEISNSVYSVSDMFRAAPETRAVNEKFYQTVGDRLIELIGKMLDPEVPFSRTDDLKTCSYCDFRPICGR